MQEKKERTTRQKIIADIVLFLCVIVVGLSVFLVFDLLKERGAYVSVKVGDGESVTYSLAIDGEYPLNGGTNILVIDGGEAYLKYADCPDKTCIRTGRISRTGEIIVCLPNRVYITVLGAGEEAYN